MFYTDNPLADFANYDAEQTRQLDKRPKCSCCDEPIQDEYCYEINDEYICPECLNEHFRKDVEDLVG